MSRKVIFQDFLVPMKIYNVIRRPDISNLGPQDLVLDRNDQISVPLALSMVLPLSETSEFRIPASKIGHRTSSDAIKNDNVGLVVFSSKILELATTQPRRGETAEAHAVALNDGSDPQDGFLKYSRGDPLWILKKPVKQRKKTVRSKESISPFAVIMANLRTGDAGYMLTTEVHLFPHRKRRTDTIAEGLLHKIGYTKC